MRRPGTRRWALETDGLLSHGDRFALWRQVAVAQLASVYDHVVAMLPRKSAPHPVLSDLPFPDSPTARRALERAEDAYDGTLKLHCLRTYAWGGLLGLSAGDPVDFELLFVASILHDLGLTDSRSQQAASHCFAVTGAREAENLVRGDGWVDRRARAVFEAISLHLNPEVSKRRHGTEAQLLAYGAQLDVVGARLTRLRPDAVQSVLQRYPRDGFADSITSHIASPQHRDSRAAFLTQIGFERLARRNPLDSQTW